MPAIGLGDAREVQRLAGSLELNACTWHGVLVPVLEDSGHSSGAGCVPGIALDGNGSEVHDSNGGGLCLTYCWSLSLRQ